MNHESGFTGNARTSKSGSSKSTSKLRALICHVCVRACPVDRLQTSLYSVWQRQRDAVCGLSDLTKPAAWATTAERNAFSRVEKNPSSGICSTMFVVILKFRTYAEANRNST